MKNHNLTTPQKTKNKQIQVIDNDNTNNENQNIVSSLQESYKKLPPDILSVHQNDLSKEIFYKNELDGLISDDITNKFNVVASNYAYDSFPFEANRSFYNRPSNRKVSASNLIDLNKSQKMNNLPYLKSSFEELKGFKSRSPLLVDENKNKTGKKSWAKRNFKETSFKTIIEADEYERFNEKFESINRFKKGFLLMMAEKYRRKLNLLSDKLKIFGDMNDKISLEMIQMEKIDKKEGGREI